MSETCQVDADLVGAPGADPDLQKRELVETPQNTIIRYSRPSFPEAGSHARPVHRIPCDPRINPSVLGCNPPLHKRQINLLDFAGCELPGERTVRAIGACHKYNAARVAIKAMNDSGTILSAYGREALKMV